MSGTSFVNTEGVFFRLIWLMDGYLKFYLDNWKNHEYKQQNNTLSCCFSTGDSLSE
jgi:hypothetical protein